MTGRQMRHVFVIAVPDSLVPDTLYVSLDYFTTSHLCACGCGSEVVLPLHPTKWRMTFDGASVSMAPSIGSRTLPCRSHYWIDKGKVRWANRMTDADFQSALERDQRDDSAWFDRQASLTKPICEPVQNLPPVSVPIMSIQKAETADDRAGIFARTRRALSRFFGLNP